MEGLPLKEKKEREVVALGKLKYIFMQERYADYSGNRENNEFHENNAAMKPKKIQITFWANDRLYKGIFDFTYMNDVLTFTNQCSTLEYTYGENSPYSTRINANRREPPCFEPRLEGPSADILQILSTKIRLQVPEHEGVTIIDEAEKDGVYISKAKLIRGLPSIYEKYGYVSGQIDYIKSQIPLLKVGILPESAKEILEEKAGLPFYDNMLIMDVMNRIEPTNEKIEGSNSEGRQPVYISNYIYDIVHRYMHMKFPFGLGPEADFKLVFNEGSDEWKRIKDRVLILDVEEVASGGRRLYKRKRNTKRRQSKRKTKRHAKKN